MSLNREILRMFSGNQAVPGPPAPKAPNVWGSLGFRASLFAGGRRPPAQVVAVNRKLLRMFRGKRPAFPEMCNRVKQRGRRLYLVGLGKARGGALRGRGAKPPSAPGTPQFLLRLGFKLMRKVFGSGGILCILLAGRPAGGA